MVDDNFVSLFGPEEKILQTMPARMRTIQSRRPQKSLNTMKSWPKNSNKNLVPLLTRISFHQILWS